MKIRRKPPSTSGLEYTACLLVEVEHFDKERMSSPRRKMTLNVAKARTPRDSISTWKGKCFLVTLKCFILYDKVGLPCCIKEVEAVIAMVKGRACDKRRRQYGQKYPLPNLPSSL